MNQKYQRYTFEQKKKAVELYFEGQSAVMIANEHGISGRRRILEWVKLVKDTKSFEVLKENHRGRPIKERTRDEETLQEEVNRLKMENLYLKKLLDLKKG